MQSLLTFALNRIESFQIVAEDEHHTYEHGRVSVE